ATVLPATCLLLLALFSWKYILNRLRAMDDWPAMAFLAIATAGAFSALLLFTGHASETYVYLPVVFIAPIVSRLLCQLLQPEGARKLPYVISMTVLVILFSCAVIVRNERVIACGATAHRIVDGFPTDRLRH